MVFAAGETGERESKRGERPYGARRQRGEARGGDEGTLGVRLFGAGTAQREARRRRRRARETDAPIVAEDTRALTALA
jgi:hypothetical protein